MLWCRAITVMWTTYQGPHDQNVSFSSLPLFFQNPQFPCWFLSFHSNFSPILLIFPMPHWCFLPCCWLSSWSLIEFTSLVPLSCHWSFSPINLWDPHVVFYPFQSFVELRSYDLLEFLWPCFGSFPCVCALFCISVVLGRIFSLNILLFKASTPSSILWGLNKLLY